MTLRPCLDCGEPTQDARCATCRPLALAALPTARARGYSAAWDRLSTRARTAQPFCTWCSSTEDLTADHLRWPARTLVDVQVLCRPCNSGAGSTRGDNPRRQDAGPTQWLTSRLTPGPPGGDAA
jgi:hypothetical protein